MSRKPRLVIGSILLLAGWLCAFLLNSLPQQSTFYILIPTLLLGMGLGLVMKTVGGRLTALTLAMTALVALLIMNQIYPSDGVTISAFQATPETSPPFLDQVLRVQVEQSPSSGVFAQPRDLEGISGLRIQLFARLPGGVRMLALGPDDRIYASLPDLGAIYQLSDTDADGFSEQPVLYFSGLERPHGLAWLNGTLYVAEPGRVLKLVDANRDGLPESAEPVFSGLPEDGGHWTRSLARAADGSLYVSVGSRCNACEEDNPLRATVLKLEPRSGAVDIFARGLRNSVGLAVAGDGTLWGSDNGRDMLGDNRPPDEINRIVEGGDYGWPYCFGDRQPDPQLGDSERCRETRPAAVELQAHSAPLGIAFGDGLNAPQAYRSSLYVAYHGSWNRTRPTGYKLVRIPLENGQPSGPPQDLVRGWLRDGTAWGRPVAPLVGPDGSLYLSDDRADAIYRISWTQEDGS